MSTPQAWVDAQAELNEAWRAINAYLGSLGIGIEVKTVFCINKTHYYLSYRRHGNSGYQVCYSNTVDGTQWTRIIDAPRHIRIGAVDAVQDLYNDLVYAARMRLPELNKAATRLHDIIDEWEEPADGNS